MVPSLAMSRSSTKRKATPPSESDSTSSAPPSLIASRPLCASQMMRRPSGWNAMASGRPFVSATSTASSLPGVRRTMRPSLRPVTRRPCASNVIASGPTRPFAHHSTAESRSLRAYGPSSGVGGGGCQATGSMVVGPKAR